MRFESLKLHSDLLKGVDDAGFERCTPVQEHALPETLAGKDLVAQSQTGTGKTAVFLLTVFNKLILASPNGDGAGRAPRALIIVPTRELAVQVESDAKKLGKHVPLKTISIYGGVEYDRQTNALREGVDVVVATPGRMIDLYKSKKLSLKDIEMFVIDEADRMFDMGFAPDVSFIASRLPKGKERQTMLFSATIDHNVRRLAARYMKKDPVEVEIEPEQVTVNSIDQKIIYASNEEKIPILLALLNRSGADRVIVFTNMKRTAEEVGFKLQGNGIKASVLTGDVSQSRRQKIMNDMKNGSVNVLVATDVAARGLHIEDITHVVNYDLPEESASYVHRIGRTARAGKSGMAYSLVCEDYALNLPEIESYIERKIESEWIEDSEMVEDKAGRYRRGRSGARAKGGAARKGSSSRGPSRGSSKSSAKGSSSGTSRSRGGGKAAQAKSEGGRKDSGQKESRGKRPGPPRPSGEKKKAQEKPRKEASPKKKKPLKTDTREERLAYYSEKYGDTFRKENVKTTAPGSSPSTEQAPAAHDKPAGQNNNGGDEEGVLKKVISFFKS